MPRGQPHLPSLALRCSPSLLRAHLFENRASFRQFGGAQSLGESAVNLTQQVARFAVLALIPPQTSQAHSRAQLKGKCPVPPCCFQGLLEAGIHILERIGTGLHQYIASQTVQFGLIEECPRIADHRESFVQSGFSLVWLPVADMRLRKQRQVKGPVHLHTE